MVLSAPDESHSLQVTQILERRSKYLAFSGSKSSVQPVILSITNHDTLRDVTGLFRPSQMIRADIACARTIVSNDDQSILQR
jgi:hypothetical protein